MRQSQLGKNIQVIYCSIKLSKQQQHGAIDAMLFRLPLPEQLVFVKYVGYITLQPSTLLIGLFLD